MNGVPPGIGLADSECATARRCRCSLAGPHSARQLLDGRPGGVDTLGQLGLVQASDRVLHDDQARFNLARLGLRQDERLEGFSRNDVGSDAALGEFDAVVETPR